jgi:hypothetical protein
MPHEQKAAFEAGATALITKPFTTKELRAAIRPLFRSRRRVNSGNGRRRIDVRIRSADNHLGGPTPPIRKESTMSKKTVPLTKKGISQLPNDKPVTYKVFNKKGENIYAGVAGKGNVRDRITDHMPGHSDTVPGGTKVQIEQHSSIREAEKKEANIISHSKPKFNQQGK